MKTKMLLAGMMMTVAAQATADEMPESCKAVVNYTAQMLAMQMEDGSVPKSIRLKNKNPNFPITSTTDLGTCGDGDTRLKDSWCQVAGGVPEVYQVEVKRKDFDMPLATLFVTYNRGGCWVDEVIRP